MSCVATQDTRATSRAWGRSGPWTGVKNSSSRAAAISYLVIGWVHWLLHQPQRPVHRGLGHTVALSRGLNGASPLVLVVGRQLQGLLVLELLAALNGG
jgi:hypothetical protein